jgi:acyl-CoA dehydrogenase
MALRYTADQEQIRTEAHRFLQDAFNPEQSRALLRQRGHFDIAFWRACVEMGWTGAGAPEAHGGLGLGPLEVCIIAEECGRFVTGAPFLAANYAALVALHDYSNEATCKDLIPRIVSGEVRFALALIEEDDNLLQPATQLTGEAVTGCKPAVVAAGGATHAIVSTNTGLVLVALDQPTVSRSANDTIDNSRCVSDLQFQSAISTRLVAPDGASARLLAIQATVTAFEQIGGAEAAMSRAQSYANTREAFGQLIGKFQAIKHRVAEMYVAIELARGNALLAAKALTEDAPDFVALAAAARLTASDAFEFACAQSIQTHGAIGVTWEHDLHLYLRRARALALELGSPLLWEDLIVDELQGARP